MLIVIAIIAILAGMLLPALSKAREKARSIACSGQQKQLNTGILMYQPDNHDYFPPFQHPGNSKNFVWCGILSAGGYLGTVKSSFKLFICPAKDSRCAKDILDTANPTDRSVLKYVDYGVNYWHLYSNRYAGGTSADGGTYYGPQAKISLIKNISSKISFADTYYATSADIGSFTLEWQNRQSSASGLLSTRHAGSVNVGWADGHVSSMKTRSEWKETAAGKFYPLKSAFDPYAQLPFNDLNFWSRN